jgi:hypothetical protein
MGLGGTRRYGGCWITRSMRCSKKNPAVNRGFFGLCAPLGTKAYSNASRSICDSALRFLITNQMP